MSTRKAVSHSTVRTLLFFRMFFAATAGCSTSKEQHTFPTSAKAMLNTCSAFSHTWHVSQCLVTIASNKNTAQKSELGATLFEPKRTYIVSDPVSCNGLHKCSGHGCRIITSMALAFRVV